MNMIMAIATTADTSDRTNAANVPTTGIVTHASPEDRANKEGHDSGARLSLGSSGPPARPPPCSVGRVMYLREARRELAKRAVL